MHALVFFGFVQDDADGAMHEAHLLSTLNHPNVLGYHESFLHDGSLCIVTQYCEEGDLFTLIRQVPAAHVRNVVSAVLL